MTEFIPWKCFVRLNTQQAAVLKEKKTGKTKPVCFLQLDKIHCFIIGLVQISY